ncbi:MAG: heavy metal-binding domain-containing protein, partial [Desulfobulbaceae bacterium]|nr:heavy metal-binding domain-containing protein [Desulfobulbaceae bacterium]
MAQDPVCGMSTEDPEAFIPYEFEGHTHHFCSDRCLAKFKEVPAAYEGKEVKETPLPHQSSDAGKYYICPMHPEVVQDKPGACPKCGMALEPVIPASPGAGKAEYTCPMHPEVIQDTPGNCPKCGMALESRSISVAEEDSNPEYEDMRRRFIVGAIFSVPVVIIAMRGLIPGAHLLDTLASARVYQWLELLLATPVVLWAGWPFYLLGVQSVVNRSLNMFTLIGLGVSVAYLYSLAGVLLPDLFPEAMQTHGGTVGVYFEAAAVI